jgi:hypothetical protein
MKNEEKFERVRSLMVEISTPNMDPAERIKKCKDAASILGVDIFGLIRRLSSERINGESIEDTFIRVCRNGLSFIYDSFYRMNHIFFLFFILFLLPSYSEAQEVECEGPPNLCEEIRDLKEAISKQKSIQKDKETEVKIKTEIKEEKENEVVGSIAFATTLAIVLRITVSILKSWKGMFKTSKSKAYLRLSLVVAGFATFVLTNVGFGLPWWQSLILAGGGPGAMTVHEILKIFSVLKGEKQYDEIDPDGDPTSENL